MEVEVVHQHNGMVLVLSGKSEVVAVFPENEWPDEWCELPQKGGMKSAMMLLAEIEE